MGNCSKKKSVRFDCRYEDLERLKKRDEYKKSKKYAPESSMATNSAGEGFGLPNGLLSLLGQLDAATLLPLLWLLLGGNDDERKKESSLPDMGSIMSLLSALKK
ncbi:hypothetical protein [Bacillus sp. 1P06AnD]|uniref:hypothetical protein n=1 Tax=Bacillus sp. 1P06AnD TaxID=3132208 RepID=UPI0039A31E4A